MKLSIKRAADILLGGGVIAYPTEGVFGLGCLPDESDAVERILEIKQRDSTKGLILIAATQNQLRGWVDTADIVRLPPIDDQRAVTWIVRRGPHVTPLLSGEHSGIAVRLTSHPVAAALCNAVASPITSTSANIAGRPVARNLTILHRHFRDQVDYIVCGERGHTGGPSEIRVLADGRLVRPGT